MKTILYMAVSVDGFIATDTGDSSWVGEADLKRFEEVTTQAGCVIMGRKTMEVLKGEDSFPMVGRLNVVMTHQDTAENDGLEKDEVIFTAQSPQEILDLAASKGFDTVCVVGGSSVSTQFLQAKLINELYITVQPLILGKGMNLLDNIETKIDLQLLDVNKLSDNEIQLHYAVQ